MTTTQDMVNIDEHNLDRECIHLSSDYLKAAHQSADAKRDVVGADNELKVVQAECAKRIRANPEKYGLDKATEAGIVSLVVTLSEFRTAQAAALNAAHDYDIAQAVVWALEHKKRALTLLVELYGMSYYSSPKVSRQGREAIEQMTQRKVRRGPADD